MSRFALQKNHVSPSPEPAPDVLPSPLDPDKVPRPTCCPMTRIGTRDAAGRVR